MTDVAKLEVLLDLDSGRFTGNLTRAGQALQVFGRQVGNQTASIHRIERSVTSLTARLRDHMVILGQVRGAMHTVWSVTGGPIAGMIKANAELERMQALMRGVAKGTPDQRAAQAKGDFDFALKLGKEAPFAINELAGAMVKLRSAGIDPTTGSMQALADSVAAFGGDDQTLHRATIAIQQMAGKGVISMEELRQQLGEAVPTAMQMMAKGAGISMAELTKKVSSGTVEARSALRILFFEMEREYAGSAKKMMTTWNGMVSRLKTEWMLFAKDIGDAGLFEQAKGGLTAAMQALRDPQTLASIKQLMGSIGELVKLLGTLAGFLLKNQKAIIEWGIAFGSVYAGAAILKGIANLKMWQIMLKGMVAQSLLTTGAIGNMGRSFGQLSIMGRMTILAGGLKAGLNALLMTFTGFSGPVGIAVVAIGGLIAWFIKLKREAESARQTMLKALSLKSGEVFSNDEYAVVAKNLDGMTERLKLLAQAKRQMAAGDTGGARFSLMALNRTGDGQTNLINVNGTKEAIQAQLEKLRVTLTDTVSKTAGSVNRSLATTFKAATQTYVDDQMSSIDADLAKVKEKYRAAENEIDKSVVFNKKDPAQAKVERDKLRTEQVAEEQKALQSAIFAAEIRSSTLVGKELEMNDALAAALRERVADGNSTLAQMKEMAGGFETISLKKDGAGKKAADPAQSALQSMLVRIAGIKAQISGGDVALAKLEEKLGMSLAGSSPAMKAMLRKTSIELSAQEKELAKWLATSQRAEEAVERMGDLSAKYEEDSSAAMSEITSNSLASMSSGARDLEKQLAAAKARMDALDPSTWVEKWKDAAEGMRQAQATIDAADLIKDLRDDNQSGALDLIVNPRLQALAKLGVAIQRIKDQLASVKLSDPNAYAVAENEAQLRVFQLKQQTERELMTPVQKLFEGWSDIGTRMQDFWGETMDNMGNALANFVTTGKLNFKDFARSILADLAKIAMQKAVAGIFGSLFGGPSTGNLGDGILKAFGSGFKPFANGGIMSSAGSLPLNKYANGGIANSPQFAYFGEGRMPEAYVPLPDGRSIPVTMKGGAGDGGVGVNVNVSIANNGDSSADVSSDSTTGKMLGQMVGHAVRDIMGKEMRQGGMLWKMRNGG